MPRLFTLNSAVTLHREAAHYYEVTDTLHQGHAFSPGLLQGYLHFTFHPEATQFSGLTDTLHRDRTSFQGYLQVTPGLLPLYSEVTHTSLHPPSPSRRVQHRSGLAPQPPGSLYVPCVYICI